MTKVLLNNQFIDKEAAKISPMDRGFLFGDGIYEVIPTYGGRSVGLSLHLARLNSGLAAIGIKYIAEYEQWQQYIQTLIAPFSSDALGVYIHVSRGADVKRFHAYPKDIAPTVFAYAFEIPASKVPDKNTAKGFKVITRQDLRWQRCHIKSTSLLGNVMHFQQGIDENKDEVILYNKENKLTEAAACNVFLVKEGIIATPKLDNQLLPGITRDILIKALKLDGSYTVNERDIDLSELKTADEVWLTSSSKELGAVIEVDDLPVGDGKVGVVWLAAQQIYNQHKFTV